MIETIIFHTIGGLGMFMFGMFSMSDALQKIAGDRLRMAINALTTNRFIAVGVGIFVTSMVQSSSVTTVMVVGFVNAGLMQLQQAIGVILGANIGTTITGWIIAIKITKYALPILGVGVCFHIFSKKDYLKDFGELAMGFGFIFFGLFIMKTGFISLKADPAFIAWFSKFGAENYSSIIMSVMVGAILTMIVQSSSATLGITIALAMSGVISFEGAAALVLGENIGTTITANLASIGTDINSRRAAVAHMVFNVIGVVFIILIFKPYITFVHYFVYEILGLASNPANFINEAGEAPHMAQYIAMSHTLFNITNTLIWLPLIGVLVKIVTLIIPGKSENGVSHLKFIDSTAFGIPAIALEKARIELLFLGEDVYTMLTLTKDIITQKGDVKSNVKQVLTLEEFLDNIQKEITVYLVRLTSRDLNSVQTREAQSMIRAIDELESIGDYCEAIVQYVRRAKVNNINFSEEATKELEKMCGKIIKFYEITKNGFINNDKTFLPEAKVSGKNVQEYGDYVREQHMKRLNEGTCESLSGLIFIDMIVGMKRISNHIMNLAEAYVGQK
ncbi:MAG: Na/Pi cotransporter family protein [Desulfobacterales bacterium]|nr:Na/Pi cotransporter family protein [Desulfobacteraceae bacterium]MBT4365265.1 Na/Pi cotransporter family protein [Desulfobacteraceae bacterium]MBT7084695.1 Na/Pi cotransporter family protein [Desulfobacterales bacterium]MBT7697479.1 Na/Pi cotransporter family protein [Desulfobacterales bacterium]